MCKVCLFVNMCSSSRKLCSTLKVLKVPRFCVTLKKQLHVLKWSFHKLNILMTLIQRALKSFTSFLFSLLWWPTRGSSVILYRFKLWLLIHWQTQSTKLTKSTLISSVFSLIICRSCFHWRPDVCEFNLHFISLEEMRFWDLLLDRRPAMKMCFISFCEKLKQSVLQMMKMCLQTSRQFV